MKNYNKLIAVCALIIWTLNCIHLIQYYPESLLVQWHGDKDAYNELLNQTNVIMLWRQWLVFMIIIALGIFSSISAYKDYALLPALFGNQFDY